MSDDTARTPEETMTPPEPSSPAPMEAPPLSAEPEDHLETPSPREPLVKRLLPVAGAAGVLLVVLAGALVVVGGGGERRGEDSLHRLSLDVAGTRTDIQILDERLARVEALEARLDTLDRRLEEAETTLDRGVVNDAEAVSARLLALEDMLAQAGSETDVQLSVLSEHLENTLAAADEAEARAAQAQAQPAAPAPRPRPVRQAATAKPPAPPVVPLRISGVEHRGGRAFLSVATGPVNSLGDVILLGERESFGEWQLVRINATTAEFSYRGRSVTVNLP